ncbi:MAG: hypothetical protein J6O87_01360 [Aeriscardovia sp.]|nr:hypothetical protein [Aeriscardovia sp.]MBP5785564.1 hypothetical protein [Aeriscardovia sp.]
MGGKLGRQIVLLEIYRRAYRSPLRPLAFFPFALFFFFFFAQIFFLFAVIALPFNSFGRFVDDVFVELA